MGAGAIGDWAGRDGTVAGWTGTGWSFHTPRPGWRAWDKAAGALVIWTGSAWIAAGSTAETLGINATADASNRLAVAAPASLFSHEGAGHRVTVNKAGPAETASLLFQSDWSGRAELGLAGEDAFSVKVSPDGAGWLTALRIDPVTGALRPVVHDPGALPSAVAAGAGALIHVTGSGPAWSDGTDWRRVSDDSVL
ncbi:DUF2793 domain-containing protein [Pelagovum pacificum]|uniref:DUF2793 domain-containing protein n=1 Tax=Pelagovum pacificum TaxID=2588711 RepID=A0A5C5G772_9RHOB|nr:DUF2793 domain-containing protein [Pelagovum pacificum]QQA45072.1 DUF2793 domain-containing protein [Pelagovum pacificum]TNY30554.1 DUF2793 domain-containing protein [Pelagovum pacificum]